MSMVNIYAEEGELKKIVDGLSRDGIDPSEIHDAVGASAKLNNPLSSPDLIVEMLKFATVVIQTSGAAISLYALIRQARAPGKQIILVREGKSQNLAFNEDTTEEKLREFLK